MKNNKYLKKLHDIKLNKKQQKLSKSKKLNLGLVDEFSFSSIEDLQEEISRKSYSVYEWFDEEFEKAHQASMGLRDVYLNNSESFIDEADVAGDEEILNQIEAASNELGIDKEEIYPDFQEHREALRTLNEIDEEFDKQVREVENWFG